MSCERARACLGSHHLGVARASIRDTRPHSNLVSFRHARHARVIFDVARELRSCHGNSTPSDSQSGEMRKYFGLATVEPARAPSHELTRPGASGVQAKPLDARQTHWHGRCASRRTRDLNAMINFSGPIPFLARGLLVFGPLLAARECKLHQAKGMSSVARPSRLWVHVPRVSLTTCLSPCLLPPPFSLPLYLSRAFYA